MYKEITKIIISMSDEKIAQRTKSFFKTAPGQYSQNDIFLGIKKAKLRSLSKKYSNTSLKDVSALLTSKYHEVRSFALLVLVNKYEKSSEIEKEKIYNFYISNTQGINNWDLVDDSAYKIVGRHLLQGDKAILYKLANSHNMWERRIAIVSTLHFTKNSKLQDTLDILTLVLKDNEDLTHKAIGWMLREVGKVDIKLQKQYIVKNYDSLARTTLRYAIERYPENERKKFLKKEFD